MRIEPRLYIIMREDLPDMNPGKGMAQAAHAQADFDFYARKNELESYHDWLGDRSFGTTIVLSATEERILQITQRVTHSGITVDPTYPWRNWYGKLFTSSEITCAWAFVSQQDDLEYMKQFELHQ
jgi:hypothetical protein